MMNGKILAIVELTGSGILSGFQITLTRFLISVVYVAYGWMTKICSEAHDRFRGNYRSSVMRILRYSVPPSLY